MGNIIIKKANYDIFSELKSIDFDSSYINSAVEKYKGKAYKIFDLKPYEANILKQLCLSLGFDCAVSRDTVTCKCKKTNAVIFATDKQLTALTEKLCNQPFRLKQLGKLIEEETNETIKPLNINNIIFDWTRPYIMGILNVTPDSFSDGGKYNSVENAIEHCNQLISDGADIIDIGGESTRPNADAVSAEEEIKRTIPIIEEIRKINKTIPISIDTRNYKTAKAAIKAGANIINDVSGLDYDNNLFEYVSKENIPVIIMHSNKVPAVQSDFTTSDIIEEIYLSLHNKIERLENAGLNSQNIIIDTGIGFGKSAEANYELLKRMNEFTSLKAPILLGISRKSFIRNTFNLACEEADIPTAIYSSMLKCVNIHRVHNVKLVKEYLNYTNKIII